METDDAQTAAIVINPFLCDRHPKGPPVHLHSSCSRVPESHGLTAHNESRRVYHQRQQTEQVGTVHSDDPPYFEKIREEVPAMLLRTYRFSPNLTITRANYSLMTSTKLIRGNAGKPAYRKQNPVTWRPLVNGCSSCNPKQKQQLRSFYSKTSANSAVTSTVATGRERVRSKLNPPAAKRNSLAGLDRKAWDTHPRCRASQYTW